MKQGKPAQVGQKTADIFKPKSSATLSRKKCKKYISSSKCWRWFQIVYNKELDLRLCRQPPLWILWQFLAVSLYYTWQTGCWLQADNWNYLAIARLLINTLPFTGINLVTLETYFCHLYAVISKSGNFYIHPAHFPCVLCVIWCMLRPDWMLNGDKPVNEPSTRKDFVNVS